MLTVVYQFALLGKLINTNIYTIGPCYRLILQNILPITETEHVWKSSMAFLSGPRVLHTHVRWGRAVDGVFPAWQEEMGLLSFL